MKALFTTTLLFSVFFCAVALLLAHEFIIGVISPRGLGVALTALLVASAVGVAVIFKSDWMRKSVLEFRDVDSGSSRGRVLVVWVAKIAVIVLMLAFLNGLLHIREKPLAPRLVGLGANLVVTFAIIRAMRNMRRGPK